MLGFERKNTKFRTCVRSVSRLGTLCGVFAMLVFVTGCPVVIAPGDVDGVCLDDGTCTDNGNFCDGAEACVEEVCTSAGDPCGDDTCNEETDHCDECTADADCDDGDVCTDDACADAECSNTSNTADCNDEDACTEDDACADGACAGTAVDCDDENACTVDTCDTGDCVNTDVECPEGETCVEGVCSLVCDDAADCDDDDLCTTDACVNNACSNTDVDCDDEVACTNDSCDADTGDCLNVDNCTVEGETCDLATGECSAEAICEADEDCDDGVFCNGDETCDLDTGNCIAGTRPCDDNDGDACTDDPAPTEECSEGDDAAVCTPCPSPSFDFTLGQDNLIGGTGDDIFNAALEFNPSSGGQVATLQTGDQANGLAGTDTLNATFNTSGTVVPTLLSGIENMNITDFTSGGGNQLILNGSNISGVDNITLVNGTNATNPFSVSALQEHTNCGFSGITDTGVGMMLTFAQSSVTSGTTDEVECTLTNSTAGTLTLATAGSSGFETCSFVSSGETANSLATLTHANTSLVTANASGAQNLTLNTIPNTVLTYDASNMTGNFQLGSGSCADQAAAQTCDYVTFATANMKNMTGGSGDDTFIFAGTFNGTDFDASGELLDGGAGSDVFQAAFGATIGTGLRIANIEELRASATANSVSINLTGITGLETATIDCDGTANTLLTFLNIGGTPLPTLNFRGNGVQTAQVCDGVKYQATGVTGNGDSLAITVGNRGTALNASGTSNAATISELQLPGIDSVSITVTDGPATFSGINNNGTQSFTTFTATASSNLTLGTVNDGTGGGTSSIVNVNLSAVTANSSATFDDLGSGASVTLGVGNDTFISEGSAGTSATINGGAGNDTITGDDGSADVINGEAGNDTIDAGTGAGTTGDTLTGGGGNDVFVYTVETDSLNTQMDTVTDFLAGTDDFDVANPPTNAGTGSGAADLNVDSRASSGTTSGTLDTDLQAAATAAAVNGFDQAGDTLIVTLTGDSLGGSGAVYLVIEDGSTGGTFTAAEDLVLLLGGSSSTTLTLVDFQ